jgi:hypothetical protein
MILATTLCGPALAVPESEPNDTFASRQVLGPEVLDRAVGMLEGSIEDIFAASDFVCPDSSLAAGDVDLCTLQDQMPGETFVAWIDNAIAGSGPDTVLGVFSQTDVLILANDDSSPEGFGDGFASALAGVVDTDGTIRLKVSGWPDFDFDGTDDDFPGLAHGESGDYRLFVRLIDPDVDFVSFTGFSPGRRLVAEVVEADFDSFLGHFGDTGNLLQSDDDGGELPLSRLEINASERGEVHLAVTIFDDLDFDGIRNEDRIEPWGVGDYLLRVPEPRRLLLIGAALAATAALARSRSGHESAPNR